MNDRLQVGIEYDYEENNLLPLLTYRWLEATEDTPAVILGTNSAWPSSEVDGNTVMVTLAQMLGQDTSATVGAAYFLEDYTWRVPASLSHRLKDNLSFSVSYDGDNLNPMLILDRKGASISLILLGGEDPAISVSLFQ